MAIKIHHGPNGAYKTSGAIQDDAIPAILAGRVIITNIRGFTLENVLNEFPDAPKSLDVINLSMESNEDLAKMRRWFMWAPRGAFLIFDETQILFPKSWRDKDLAQFDFPGGIEAAKEADRPTEWLDAWTRHRHWNWDIVLTTPNIKYIRDEIRLTCEKAYLHANLGLLGPAVKFILRSDYKEAMHDAQENRPGADGSIVEFKKIKPSTFRLYQSTATGIVSDTTAGKSLFASPKVLGLLAFIALAIGFIVSSDGADIFTCGLACSDAAPVVQAAAVAVPSGGSAPAAVPVEPDSHAQVDQPPVVDHPYAGYVFKVRAAMSGFRNERARDLFLIEVVDAEGLYFIQTGDQLKALGYQLTFRSECYVEMRRDAWTGSAICQGRERLPPVEPVPYQQPPQAPQLTAQQQFELSATRITVVGDTSREEVPFAD